MITFTKKRDVQSNTDPVKKVRVEERKTSTDRQVSSDGEGGRDAIPNKIKDGLAR